MFQKGYNLNLGVLQPLEPHHVFRSQWTARFLVVLNLYGRYFETHWGLIKKLEIFLCNYLPYVFWIRNSCRTLAVLSVLIPRVRHVEVNQIIRPDDALRL